MISSIGFAAPVSRIAGEGMQRAVERLHEHAGRIARAGLGDARGTEGTAAVPGPGSDAAPATIDSTLIGDMVGMIGAKHSFLASLAVFKTSDRMTGALLDALA